MQEKPDLNVVKSERFIFGPGPIPQQTNGLSSVAELSILNRENNYEEDAQDSVSEKSREDSQLGAKTKMEKYSDLNIVRSEIRDIRGFLVQCTRKDCKLYRDLPMKYLYNSERQGWK